MRQAGTDMNRIPVLILRMAAALAVFTFAAGAGVSRAQTGGSSEEKHPTMHAPGKKAGVEAETPGHSHEKCELHGGQVAMTDGRHFETVFAPDGIRVYVYTGNQSPEMVGKGTGTATLMYKDGASKEIPFVTQKPEPGETTVYFCPMHPDVVQMKPGTCPKCGDMVLYAQDYFYAKADLAKVAPGSLKATIRIKGLRGLDTEVVYTEPFTGPSAPHHEAAHAAPAAPHEGADTASHGGHMR